MSKLQQYCIALLAVPWLALGCREKLNNPDQIPPANGSISWVGNSACDGCLQSYCGNVDGGQSAYKACEQQESCQAAMSKFTACYASKSSLVECSPEMSDVRSSSQSGSQLLDCFLLECFFTVCETVRNRD